MVFPEFFFAHPRGIDDDQHQEDENDQYLEYFLHAPEGTPIFAGQIIPMDLQLQGRTALVLASSKGLGKACAATTLAAEGADVVIGARDAATLEAAAEDIRRTAKGRVLAIPVDVSVPADADKMIEAALSTFGRIDILVNNAGGPPFGRFESFDDEAWQKAFELTLLSAVRWSRLAIPHLKASGSGRIINIVSLSVKTFLE